MRGYPFLQMLIIAVLFAVAAIPVWRLTRPPAAVALPVRSTAATSTARKALVVELRFAPAPGDFQLSYLGKTLLTGRGPTEDFTVPWNAEVPPEGADLALQANWPSAASGAHVAARLSVRFPDGHEATQTAWGDTATPMVEIFPIKR